MIIHLTANYIDHLLQPFVGSTLCYEAWSKETIALYGPIKEPTIIMYKCTYFRK